MEDLWNGIGDAIADIREKVVEEPMWGRALSGPDDGPQWPEPQQQEPAPEPEPDIELER